MGVQARGTVAEMEAALVPWPPALTELTLLPLNHHSLLETLTGFCFPFKPLHGLLLPWDSPIFKVKCNKRQLVSSRVNVGAALGSCHAAEHGGDT